MDDELREVEKRVSALEVVQAAFRERITHGMSQGAAEEFNKVQRQLDRMREDMAKTNDQIKRWQGGSAVIYMAVTVLGTVIGWFISHFVGVR